MASESNRKMVLFGAVALIILIVGGVYVRGEYTGSSALSAEAEQSLRQTVADTTLAPADRWRAQSLLDGSMERIVIRIDRDGSLMLGGKPYSVEAFEIALNNAVERVASRGGAWAEHVCAVIESDPRADFGAVEDMVKIVLKNDVRKISLYVTGGRWQHVGTTEKGGTDGSSSRD